MVRSYRPQPVPDESLQRVMEIARRGPSAGFSQGQSFVVVRDATTRAQIADIADEPAYLARGFEPWLSRAPVHVVCCVSEKAYRDRYGEPDKADAAGPDGWSIPYWFVDGGCCLMLLLLAAVDQGWAAGFLGLDGPRLDQVRQLLRIPPEVMPIGVVTIGLPAPDRRSGSIQRGWKPTEAVIHWDEWGGQLKR